MSELGEGKAVAVLEDVQTFSQIIKALSAQVGRLVSVNNTTTQFLHVIKSRPIDPSQEPEEIKDGATSLETLVILVNVLARTIGKSEDNLSHLSSIV